MKIDIHVHTKKIKSGDAATRTITAGDFVEIIKNTDVKILAITNHNHFDLNQYNDFQKATASFCQIWPGVELDIMHNGKRAHLIVICNPDQSDSFSSVLKDLISDSNADTFITSIDQIAEKCKSLDCIYIAHYYAKKPDLDDEGINRLIEKVGNPRRILKEATNALAAGIYISHGHNSIYGSDVHNWADYAEISQTLPELRLPVESFAQFCLLLNKDEPTINTLLNKKVKESVMVRPFKSDEPMLLDIFNDINILFGSKGTGKTEILEALSKHFNSKGHKTSVYKSNDNHLNDAFDIRAQYFDKNASDFGVEECTEEVKQLKTATEGEVTSLSRYLAHFSVQETNKISQKLLLKNIKYEDETLSARNLADTEEVHSKFHQFKEYVTEDETISSHVNTALIYQLVSVLSEIISELKAKLEGNLLENKSIHLLNNLVTTFVAEISKKTGLPPKPTKTGFSDYSRNRIKLERATRKILGNMQKEIIPFDDYAGNLGDKGELRCRTLCCIQDGSITDSSYQPVKDVKKTPQKAFASKIRSVLESVNSENLFEKISDLNDIEGIETINCISDLLLVTRHFTLNDLLYTPSNGESSMILLHKELSEEKDIYLIDEPEKSLGNDYINDVIVPLLKEKAALGKKIVVATHDANISIRTLPYNSMYRLHDRGRYYTLSGNPFSNSLKCKKGEWPDLDWKEISMKTLEGGKEAFGERGKIYGN
jgi:predicted ATPase